MFPVFSKTMFTHVEWKICLDTVSYFTFYLNINLNGSCNTKSQTTTDKPKKGYFRKLITLIFSEKMNHKIANSLITELRLGVTFHEALF